MAGRGWWIFLIALFLLGLGLQEYLLSALAAMLAMVSGLAHWWRERSLDQVYYHRRLYYTRGFPGETIALNIEVENKKLQPLSWLFTEDTWPVSVAPVEPNVVTPTEFPEVVKLINLFSLRWNEKARRSYTLELRKRGVYALGPVKLESGDLFGIFSHSRQDEQTDLLTVFPEPLPPEFLGLPANDPFGDRRSRRKLFEDPSLPMGVREYRPEDDFRRVHWPATARVGSLQSKVYQPISGKVLVICLNVSTMIHTWQGYLPELLEHLVRVTAGLAQLGLQDGYRVGLVSNGCLAHADQPFRVSPGRSPGQLASLFATLAAVTPIVSDDFERFLSMEVTHLPYGATLVVVTGLVTPTLPETLLKIKRHGHLITLFTYEHKPPPWIPGIQVYHHPFYETH